LAIGDQGQSCLRLCWVPSSRKYDIRFELHLIDLVALLLSKISVRTVRRYGAPAYGPGQTPKTCEFGKAISRLCFDSSKASAFDETAVRYAESVADVIATLMQRGLEAYWNDVEEQPFRRVNIT
jgi:hypothetical protein